MTDLPTPPSGARGAIDLSALGGAAHGAPTSGGGLAAPAGASTGGAPAPTAGPTASRGLHVAATDATFNDVLSRHLAVPGLLVLWTAQYAETKTYLDDVERIVSAQGGRLVLVSIDLAANPELTQVLTPMMTQAFGQPSVPATFGLIQGQPVPLFPGVQPPDQIAKVVEQLLELAVKNGVTGRVQPTADDATSGDEGALPPLHQKAFDAIEAGDFVGADAAYREALAANPKDAEAAAGLAQVALLQRTEGVDVSAARAAAANDPADIEAALNVADIDLLGGHVEDAFTRLIDLVRASEGEERDRVRTHLLELFTVVGNHDERVRKGRTALMNALF